MAVGAIYAGWLIGDGAVTLAGALALSIGIAIQNFPRGEPWSLSRCGLQASAAKNHS